MSECVRHFLNGFFHVHNPGEERTMMKLKMKVGDIKR